MKANRFCCCLDWQAWLRISTGSEPEKPCQAQPPASGGAGRCSVSLGARAGTGESLEKYAASCAKEEDGSEDFKIYNYLLTVHL